MKENKLVVTLLALIAILLLANLVVSTGSPVRSANADIVEGKNIFSTHSPDGTKIYIWGYMQSGGLNAGRVDAYYYGSIDTSGKFSKK